MSFVKTLVLARFLNLYGSPKCDDEAEFFGEFHKALNGYCEKVLRIALDRVVRNRLYPTWPTVGEVNRMCAEVSAELAPTPAASGGEDWPMPSDAERARVQRLTAELAAKLSEPPPDRRQPDDASCDAFIARAKAGRSWSLRSSRGGVQP